LIDSISEKVRWQGSEKLIIVIDAGISSEDNLIELNKSGYDYICVSRSEHQKYRKMVNYNDLKEIFTTGGEKLRVQSFAHQITYKEVDKSENQTEL